MTQRFAQPLILAAATAAQAPALLADRGIAGAAAYDGLVALAAIAHGLPLATRDARTRGTYDALGVQTLVVA